MSSTVRIEPISSKNVEDVAGLLHERNRTIREYVYWKYGMGHGQRGVLARDGGEAIGCFGLVPRTLSTAEGRALRCGWFADWYVSPAARQHGVGRMMLDALSEQVDVVVGHPGTEKAQALCRQAGYQPLGFQSRRLLVLNRWGYETARTHYPPKAMYRMIAGAIQSLAQKQTATNPTPIEACGWLTKPEQFGEWIAAQPVAPPFTRHVRTWERDGLKIVFAHERGENLMMRGRVLYSTGRDAHSLSLWRLFADHVRGLGCLYAELFTTNSALDAVWSGLGAVRVQDSAVVALSPRDAKCGLQLHGWDRENWTYLAYSR